MRSAMAVRHNPRPGRRRMSYERAMYERLICDGCGVAVLETEDVLSHAPDWGWSVGDKHLCHMCRPDSPSEAIQRVREQLHKPWKYECECCTRIWIALEGDSDE